jgi:hypothetical protein
LIVGPTLIFQDLTRDLSLKKSSPAMLEGFTDHRLTLEELLMWRVPE